MLPNSRKLEDDLYEAFIFTKYNDSFTVFTSVKIKNHGAKILLIHLLHFMLLNIMFIFSLFVVAPSKKSP